MRIKIHLFCLFKLNENVNKQLIGGKSEHMDEQANKKYEQVARDSQQLSACTHKRVRILYVIFSGRLCFFFYAFDHIFFSLLFKPIRLVFFASKISIRLYQLFCLHHFVFLFLFVIILEQLRRRISRMEGI